MGCGSVYPYVFLGWSWQIFLVPFEFNKIILCFEDLFKYGDREVGSTEFFLKILYHESIWFHSCV